MKTVKCIKTMNGLDDFGASGFVFECVEFKEGETYDIRPDGYILSESNCLFLLDNNKEYFTTPIEH